MCGGLVGTVSAVWMWSPLGLEGVFSDQQKQALQCNTHMHTNKYKNLKSRKSFTI